MKNVLSLPYTETVRVIRLRRKGEAPPKKPKGAGTRIPVVKPDHWSETCGGFGDDTHYWWTKVAEEVSEWRIIRFTTGLLGVTMNRDQKKSYCFPPGSVVPIRKDLVPRLAVRPHEMQMLDTAEAMSLIATILDDDLLKTA